MASFLKMRLKFTMTHILKIDSIMKFVLLIQLIEILDNIFHSCLFIDAILKCSQDRWHLLRLSFNSQM